MTQASRPVAEHIGSFPTGDSGPYSGPQWREAFQVLFTGDQHATQGPLIEYLNSLEVTTAAGNISVDTGAGLTSGNLLINDASVTFSPSHPAANPRVDVVVMCLNATNAVYNTNLEFPTVLTDYNLTASIEPYSCRLALLIGAEAGAPVPRVPVQTANYFQVPLAQYQIAVGGAVSALTDRRDWAMTPLASVQKLDEQVLAAAGATITFNNIPQVYRNLKVIVNMQSNMAAPGPADILALRFNADAGNNYDFLVSTITTTGVSAAIFTSPAAYIFAGEIDTVNFAGANYASGSEILIPDYRGSWYKQVLSYGSRWGTGLAGSVTNFQTGGWWRNTAAITRIDLVNVSATTWTIGSRATLYGLT